MKLFTIRIKNIYAPFFPINIESIQFIPFFLYQFARLQFHFITSIETCRELVRFFFYFPFPLL